MAAKHFYSTLIFDLGDVLFTWSSETKTSISPSVFMSFLRSNTWFSYEMGHYDEAECYSALSAEFHIPVEEIHTAMNLARTTLRRNPQLLGLIRELKKGRRVIAMSNVSSPDWEFMKACLGVDWDVFDHVFTSAAAGLRKPDVDFFKHIIQELDLDPLRTIFVDDSPANVAAAQSLGMHGIIFKGFEDCQWQLRALCVDTKKRGVSFPTMAHLDVSHLKSDTPRPSIDRIDRPSNRNSLILPLSTASAAAASGARPASSLSIRPVSVLSNNRPLSSLSISPRAGGTGAGGRKPRPTSFVAIPVSDEEKPLPEPVTPTPPTIASATRLRKCFLFAIFCIAQFLDVFNNSALFASLPYISTDLKMDDSEAAWLLSSYSLTFASFLLVSGRFSDVYSPKPVFITGITVLGSTSLGAGFVREKIVLLVLRAISGIGAALTIPPALKLITQMFPDPTSKARAISIFGGTAALANILGLFAGALFVQYATWPWIFWFLAILALPSAAVCFFLIPTQIRSTTDKKDPRLDLIGVSTLTIALILFIFAIITGSGTPNGWTTPAALAPLIISIFMIAGFLFWETRIPEEHAALPPKMWFYPNFSVLFGVALLPYFWWRTAFMQFTYLWQEVYHYSAIVTAAHFLPIGVVGAIVILFAGTLPRYFSLKVILVSTLSLILIASLMLPFADHENFYWPLVFPALCIGTLGVMLVFCTTNIAIFKTAPEAAATIGAVFNAAIQLGSAIGIAVVSSIQSGVDSKIDQTLPGATHYEGRSAGFWFVFAVVAVEILAVLVFFKPQPTNAAVVPAPSNERSFLPSTGKKSMSSGRPSPVQDEKVGVVLDLTRARLDSDTDVEKGDQSKYNYRLPNL